MPLIKVNCAAIPETLLESELFGHVRGAFTGAATSKKGKFALADGGTILLDEIGTMSPVLQSKLLRVLQEREFEPLGSERSQQVDVRVIAATNRDLRQMVLDGTFQEDLFYRLNVIPIEMPPLRNRREDIPVLAEHFVRKHQQRTGKRIERIEDGVLEKLAAYEWPGNVRELENTIERAVVLSTNGVISAASISVLGVATGQSSTLPSLKLRTNIEWIEQETIRRALDSAGGVKKDAADLMGISQRALSYYLSKYKLPITGRVSGYAPRNGVAAACCRFRVPGALFRRHRLCLPTRHETASCLDRAFGARVVGAGLRQWWCVMRFHLVAAAVLLFVPAMARAQPQESAPPPATVDPRDLPDRRPCGSVHF